MKRTRGCIWLTAGILVALLAGTIGFLTLSSASGPRQGQGQTTAAAPDVQIVVAKRAVPVRVTLTADDVELKTVAVDAAPEGSLRQTDQAIGKVTLADLYAGEVIVSSRLLDPNITSGDGRLALMVTDDQVLLAVPATDLLSRINVLKPGDHVDLLFSLEFPVTDVSQEAGSQEKRQETFHVLQNLTVAAIRGGTAPAQAAPGTDAQATTAGGAPEAILLTINPQDALVLKYMIDAGGVMDVVLRAPGATQPYGTEPVDVRYMINRYQIPVPPLPR